MKKFAFICCCLTAMPAHAQSTGIPWENGRVLTAPMLQSLDSAKVNIQSLGQPGSAPKLNALGQITNPVIGDVSQAKATSDGQTVVQVTAKAANAVQKTDVGAASGVAPLDANKMMPAPVSGDSSASPTQSKYATFGGAPGASRTMADRFGDTWNLKDFGMKMDGSTSDATIFNNLLVPSNTVFTYSNGSLPSSDKLNTKSPMGLVQLTGPNASISPNIDGWVFEGLGDGKEIARNVRTGIQSASTVTIHSYFAYTGNAGQPQLYNHSVVTDSSMDADGNIVTPNGMMVNFNATMNSHGGRQSGGTDIAGQFITHRTGTDWNWNSVFVMHEQTNASISKSSTQEWNQELDYGARGSEGPRSVRHGIMQTGWTEGGGYGSSWQASHAYNAGDAIEVEVDGIAVSALVTQAGTTGTMAPDWSGLSMSEADFVADKAPATLTDGSVTWAYNGRMLTHVDSAHALSYQPDNFAGQQDADLPQNAYGSQSRTTFVYGSYLKTDAVFDGAILNFAASQFVNGVTPVWARVPAGSYVDLSGNASGSNNNVRLLGYDPSEGSLVYKINGNTVFSINNVGLHTSEETYGISGSYSDPAVGKTYDVKFGGLGIASSVVDTHKLLLSGPAYLNIMSKPAILALPSPVEGQKVYDGDDHAEVTYRCPTSSTCGWFPVQYGAALSN
ncbi:hypothetical protein [Acetobacter malorum]|uniref:hypothetical protein n=1 Tax=Acetobacter malorum TaxID=178901 RepID=UPI0039EB0C3A